jgi:hypothetical protein
MSFGLFDCLFRILLMKIYACCTQLESAWGNAITLFFEMKILFLYFMVMSCGFCFYDFG